jgi:ApeA N-terminal domain 1
MSGFPNLPVEPGDYDCRWFVDGETLPGSISLRPLRLPSITIYDDRPADQPVWFGVGRRLPRLEGQLRTNQDIVVLNAYVEPFMLGRMYGQGSHALVGMDVRKIRDDRYDAATVQITDSYRFFGWPAIVGFENGTTVVNGKLRFAALVNRDPTRRWRDARAGLTVTCTYMRRFAPGPTQLAIDFAPVTWFESDEPRSLQEWFSDIIPLAGLTTFALGRPQQVSWLTLEFGKGRSSTEAVVFGGGIHQEPHAARQWIDKSALPPYGRPYFTLESLRPQHRLPRILSRWRELSDDGHPFLPLYAYVLDHPDLPVRARFLQLAQALEACDAYERRKIEAQARSRFLKRREAFLREVSTAISASARKELEAMLMKSPHSGLSGRLYRLLRALPETTRRDLDRPELAPLRLKLRQRSRVGNASHDELAELRNALSHGESYPDEELEPWLRALEIVARATLMRLLRFNASEVEAALADRR